MRVRVLVPFGIRLDLVRTWLDDHVGKRNYWVDSDCAHGRDTASVFFTETWDAHRFADGVVRLEPGREEDRPL